MTATIEELAPAPEADAAIPETQQETGTEPEQPVIGEHTAAVTGGKALPVPNSLNRFRLPRGARGR